MDRNLDFDTYLFISSKKLIISVNTDSNYTIYKKELSIEEESRLLILNKLDHFLNENIFKIEKRLNNFVKKIFIIMDLKDFFQIELSIKKNNYGNSIDIKSLNYLLNEAKDCCKKTMEEKKVIHMIIENYLINNKNFSYLPKEINSNTYSIDLKFICLSNDLIKNLEEILRKYQISIGRIISADYMRSLFSEKNYDMIKMAKETIDGCNKNEVMLIPKTRKNMGFFEKFFHFFG